MPVDIDLLIFVFIELFDPEEILVCREIKLVLAAIDVASI